MKTDVATLPKCSWGGYVITISSLPSHLLNPVCLPCFSSSMCCLMQLPHLRLQQAQLHQSVPVPCSRLCQWKHAVDLATECFRKAVRARALFLLLLFVLFIYTLKTFSMKYITIHLCSVQHNGKHSQHGWDINNRQ